MEKENYKDIRMKKLINVGSDCSGVGAFIQALQRLKLDFKEEFSCDFDYYARCTYLLNYGTKGDIELSKTKEHKFYADNVKKIALSEGDPTEKEKVLLNNANDFAKKFSFYYPFNMYEREIPTNPSDIYVSSVPCQSFSLAGKRKGENSKNGILFYNSHEFIQKNKPRYFIFENVKGLLSDNGGKTFQTWCDMLGGKSVNGNPVIFPHQESVPYHIYHKVINAKNCGVPQNRERIFIVGIRDDQDNTFTFPKDIHLTKRLKDVLEENVDEKYYLSDKLVKGFIESSNRHKEKGTGFQWSPKSDNEIANCLRANAALNKTDNSIKVGYINQDTQASQVYDSVGVSPTLSAGTHGYAQGYVKVKSATKKGYEVASEGDSINLTFPESDTRRGRVGVGQTLDTSCNQGVLVSSTPRIAPIRGRNPENPTSRETGLPTQQMLEINQNGTSNALTTVQKDNVVIQLNTSKESNGVQPYKQNRIYDSEGVSPVLDTECGRPNYLQKVMSLYENDSDAGRVYSPEGISCTIKSEGGGGGAKTGLYAVNYRIRRLTPMECFRLMDFPETFTWNVSDTQAYKQAGNSIVVACLVGIIGKLNFLH